ncbi:mechanosensitive ion channel family protein [Glycomyces sp. YM15]|uniref:mechanosensitive ion channel family protein n=1 Tax=Glycomyces sp. YM15 TaxID=2800446 RepID=UPI0019666DA8|nr:mechanosensitive ion channel domain-containing protein [Glycomyces sp. YM15]
MRNLDPWIVIVAVALLSAVVVSLTRLLVTWLVLRHASERWSRVIGKALHPAQFMAATGGVQILLLVHESEPGWGGGSPNGWNANLSQGLLFGTAASGAWLVSNLLSVAKDPIQERWGSLHQSDVGGRKRRTQVIVLYRLISAGVWMVAVGLVLFNIPELRAFGTTMLGAAGVAAVVASLAAQTMLSNLFAGLSLAFGDALRLEDVVVIEGEWGRIEEITLSYVVVRIWDERRLILPTKYFNDHAYVNWTRDHPQVMGTVKMDVDWRLPVEAARVELRRFLSENPLWDGREAGVVVLDSTGPYMQLRMLISARNPSDQWDLRCEVREHMIQWIVQHHRHCIPRMRVNSYQSVMDARGGVFSQEGVSDLFDGSEIQALLNEVPIQQRRAEDLT